MRYSTGLGLFLIVLFGFICLLCFDIRQRTEIFSSQAAYRDSLQKKTGLPDLAITTAARYLRHYSLTDLATPFQDYPLSQEHFPASFSYAPPDFSTMPRRISLIPVQRQTDP